MSVLRRLVFLVRRRRLDRELQEEMQWHVERRTQALVAEGMDEASARTAARRAFGNLTHLREESRDYWGFVWLELLAQDVRHACRALARGPLLAGIAILSLGSSMAACCAVFALAHSTLFATVAVPNPDGLKLLRWTARGSDMPCESLDGWMHADERQISSASFSYDAFLAARRAAEGSADVFGFAGLWHNLNVAIAGRPEILSGQAVSGNYFRALELKPAAGRFFDMVDDRDDANPVAVISHALWLRRFARRPDVVGTTVRINRVPTVIVGVTPAGFNGTRQIGETSDVTLPIALYSRFVREDSTTPGQTADDSFGRRDPRYWWVNMMARVPSQARTTGVQAEIDRGVRAAVIAGNPAVAKQAFRTDLEPGAQGMTEMRARLVPTVAVMAAIALLVVVIACANLATLLLARGVARDREVGVRCALGASRGRLVRAMLVESLIIGLLGGGVGLLASGWVAHGLLPALGLPPETTDIPIGAPVLAFAFCGALITSLLFGLAPAWRGSDVRPMNVIKDGGGSVASRVPRLRTARTILTFQVGMSIVVLIVAGLLVQTLRNLQHVQTGFDSRNVLVFRVDPTLNHYDSDRTRQLYADVLARVRSLPGVAAATFSQHGLLGHSQSRTTVARVDGVKPPRLEVTRLIVDPGFFQTMRIPLLAGRGFSGLETPTAIRPVVINRAFALRAFHVSAPIGHRFRFSDTASRPTYEVIGVAGDVAVADVREGVPATAYFSYREEDIQQANFAVRAHAAPYALLPSIRRAVAEVDSDLPIDRVLTQDEQIAQGLQRERLFATLASALGVLALFLACVGTYGVMAYAVSRRTTEIGVRLALGARPQSILLMVAGEATRVLVLGVALGLAAAFAASRYLQAMLFGLPPRDIPTQVFAVVVLSVVLLAAALVPARRAARTDPLTALRNE